MSEVANVFNNFRNLPRKSEEGNPSVLEIDELVTKSLIDSSKDRF